MSTLAQSHSPVVYVAATHNPCAYNHGTCTAPRVIKSNGQLHRLCDEHRSRYTAYQKIYTLKQTALRVQQFNVLSVDDGSLSASAAIDSDDTALWSDEMVFRPILEVLCVPQAATSNAIAFAVLDGESDDSVCDGVDAALETLENRQSSL